MSHDVENNDKANASRIIYKPRIIAGLLGEMDAAGAILILKSELTSVNVVTRIRCDVLVPFENSIVKVIAENVDPATYLATALFAGQRIDFNLSILDRDGTCSLPTELRLVDFRANKRRSFGPETMTAEILAGNSVVFATPIDFSQNSMAFIAVTDDPPLQVGQTVEVHVRGGSVSRDVFSFSMAVHAITKHMLSTKILLRFPNDQNKNVDRNDRKVSRRGSAQINISLSPVDTHVGADITCRVYNLSLTGLCCEILESDKPMWITTGLQIKLHNSPIFATVMWQDREKIGLRIDALDESRTLNSWYRLLNHLSLSHSVHHSQIDDLVALFTESGLLRGARRRVFGSQPGKFLPPPAMTENPLLYHRIACSAHDGRFSGQVSMVRLTDDFWCLQEGTHTGDNGVLSYDDLLRAIHRTAQELSSATHLAPRYVGALVHKSIRSSSEYFERFLKDPANRSFDMLQMSLSRQLEHLPESRGLSEIKRLSLMSPTERQAVANSFDPLIYEVFSGLNGNHPRLNAELALLGPSHRAESVILTSKGASWGLAYRLRSYYAVSSTGVMNSLFLILRHDSSLEVISSGILRLVDDGFSRGTDDLVLIIDSHFASNTDDIDQFAAMLSTHFRSLKPFKFYVVDSVLNQELI